MVTFHSGFDRDLDKVGLCDRVVYRSPIRLECIQSKGANARAYRAFQNIAISLGLKGSALSSGPKRRDYSKEVLTIPEKSSTQASS